MMQIFRLTTAAFLSTLGAASAATTMVSILTPHPGPADPPTTSTEVFAETETITAGTGGNVGAESVTTTYSYTGACVVVSFDVTISTLNGGNLVEDAGGRGFGEAGGGGGNNAISDNNEGLELTISAPTITPLNNSSFITSITGNLTYGFTGFNLVNNGGNNPEIDWIASETVPTTASMSGFHVNAAGTGSGNSEAVALPTAPSPFPATTINLTRRDNSFLWLNDFDFSISGSLEIIKVPEPSRAMLLLIGFGTLIIRRRR